MISPQYVRLRIVLSVFLGVICLATASPMTSGVNNDAKNNFEENGSRECTKGAVDLVFVVDESGSISPTDFNQTLKFLANLVNSLDIGSTKGQNQVALVKFSDKAKLVFPLNVHNRKQQLYNRILATKQETGGGTNIASGINMAWSRAFNSQNGDRRDVPNMMLVLTDGQDNFNSNIIGAQRATAANNITVAVIGIGNAVNRTELETIVGGNLANIYNAESFNALDSLTKEICIGTPTITQKSTGSPWKEGLLGLLIIPLAFIICVALFIIPLRRRKRMTREQIIADVAAVDMNAFAMGKTEQDDSSLSQFHDVRSKPILMPPFDSLTPLAADRKWNTTARDVQKNERNCDDYFGCAVMQNGYVSRPALLVPSASYRSPNVPPHEITEDVAGVVETDTSRSTEKVHYVDPEIEAKVKSATRRQALLPPKAKLSQNSDPNFTSDANADVQVKTAEIRRPLLPPKTQIKAAVVLKGNCDEDAFEETEMQKDESKHASNMRNRSSKENALMKGPSQIWGGIASDDIDSSKAAVVIRRNGSTDCKYETGRESGIGYGQIDAPKIAQLVHVEGGVEV